MKRLARFFFVVGLLGSWGFAQETVTIRPSDLVPFGDPVPGWRFGSEGALPAAHGSLVIGPQQPPLGAGSAGFSLFDLSGGMTLQYFSPDLVGIPIAELTRLEYCTYVEESTGPQTVSIQFNFDDDVSDADTSYKGRLVYEPRNTPGNLVVLGQWQCWDALAGYWWGTGAPLNPYYGIDHPGSLMEILSLFPNAGFNAEFGGLILKAGSGWESFTGYADAVSFGSASLGEITYDFEQEPADKDACKDGSWQNFGFPNQGECLEFVEERERGAEPWADLYLPPVVSFQSGNP